MQIRRFFTEAIPEAGQCFALSAEESRHAVKVLRLRVGDVVRVVDGAGGIGDAMVADIAGGRRPEVFLEVTCRACLAPSPVALHLFIAPPRGKTMNLTLRCAVELGVSKITPILCRYGVSRPDRENAKHVWRDELIASLKQSGNPFLPEVNPVLSFAEAVEQAPALGVFGAVPCSGSVSHFQPPTTGEVGVWIGPEGGFAEDEEEMLRSRGYLPLTVGRWILRVETAVPALLGHLYGMIPALMGETR